MTFESLQTLNAIVSWMQDQFVREGRFESEKFPMLKLFNQLVALRGNGEPVSMTIHPEEFGEGVRIELIQSLELELLEHIITSRR